MAGKDNKRSKQKRRRQPVDVLADSNFGRIPDAKRRSGLSRSKLYELAASNTGLFLKLDKATIVDLAMLDRVLAALPAAEISGKGADRAGAAA
jgi:hypothetical protein